MGENGRVLEIMFDFTRGSHILCLGVFCVDYMCALSTSKADWDTGYGC
jgi:hypothetical protein